MVALVGNRKVVWEGRGCEPIAIKLRKSLHHLLPCFEEFYVEFNKSFECLFTFLIVADHLCDLCHLRLLDVHRLGFVTRALVG